MTELDDLIDSWDVCTIKCHKAEADSDWAICLSDFMEDELLIEATLIQKMREMKIDIIRRGPWVYRLSKDGDGSFSLERVPECIAEGQYFYHAS